MSAEKTIVDLRDAIFDRLTTPAFPFQYATVRKTPLPTLQADALPSLSVLILDSDSTPDGDPNIGDIRFVVDTTIAISVVRGLADVAVLEGDIDRELETMKATLFEDPSFTSFWNTYLFESIPRVRRRWYFPTNGDEYRIELRYEITFRKRERFQPLIVDDFNTATLTVRQAGSDPNAPGLTVVVAEAQ